jgi:hypothetical protein
MHQAGLAHTRFSHQGHDLTMARLRPCQGLVERLQLLLPSHKGRQAPRSRRLQGPPHRTGAHEIKHLDGLDPPLHWHRSQGTDLHQALHQPQGSGRQARAAGGGQLFHTRRQMRRLPHGGIVHVQVITNGAYHHFARVEPHAHAQLQTAGATHLLGIGAHRGLHGQGGVAGAQGVVFVANGGAKQGHDAVAEHLIDGALEAVRCWAASGSRPRMSSVESLRSANSTVTCLRSPARAGRTARIFSARCGGV